VIWLDRLGLVLQFISFWLVAPEILGEQRVRRLGDALGRVLSWLLFAPIGVVALAGAAYFAFREGELVFRSVLHGILFMLALIVPAALGYHNATQKQIPRLIQAIEDFSEFRRLLLAVGAGLFSLGFALQLISTFWHPSH